MSTRDYSDETATVIDEEVQRILTEGEDRCRTLLTENRHALTLIARALLERETISGEEVNRLVGLSTDTGSGGDTSQTTVDESAGEASGTVSSPSPAPVD
jgi:cell division protease FtsH